MGNVVTVIPAKAGMTNKAPMTGGVFSVIIACSGEAEMYRLRQELTLLTQRLAENSQYYNQDSISTLKTLQRAAETDKTSLALLISINKAACALKQKKALDDWNAEFRRAIVKFSCGERRLDLSKKNLQTETAFFFRELVREHGGKGKLNRQRSYPISIDNVSIKLSPSHSLYLTKYNEKLLVFSFDSKKTTSYNVVNNFIIPCKHAWLVDKKGFHYSNTFSTVLLKIPLSIREEEERHHWRDTLKKGGNKWLESDKLGVLKEVELSRIAFPHRYYRIFHRAGNKVVFIQSSVGDKNLSDLKFTDYSADELHTMAISLLTVLADLHEKGIIHSDLKPENIRLKGLQCFLIDLGLSTKVGNSYKGTTPNYAPPEYLIDMELDDKTVKATTSIDIFSVGVILYQLLVLDCFLVYDINDASTQKEFFFSVSSLSPRKQAYLNLAFKMTHPQPLKRPALKTVLAELKKAQSLSTSLPTLPVSPTYLSRNTFRKRFAERKVNSPYPLLGLSPLVLSSPEAPDFQGASKIEKLSNKSAFFGKLISSESSSDTLDTDRKHRDPYLKEEGVFQLDFSPSS